MCCSALGQILYGAIMLLALGLTATSMFTPGWHRFDHGDNVPENVGLFGFLCRMPDSSTATPTNGTNSGDVCKDWFKNLPTWEKVVVAGMCIALVLEIVALVWNLVTFCTCCCKKYLIHPLSGLAVLISIALAVAVILFGIKNKDDIKDIDKSHPLSQLRGTSEVSYSFWLACAALAAALADILVAGITICFADRCL